MTKSQYFLNSSELCMPCGFANWWWQKWSDSLKQFCCFKRKAFRNSACGAKNALHDVLSTENKAFFECGQWTHTWINLNSESVPRLIFHLYHFSLRMGKIFVWIFRNEICYQTEPKINGMLTVSTDMSRMATKVNHWHSHLEFFKCQFTHFRMTHASGSHVSKIISFLNSVKLYHQLMCTSLIKIEVEVIVFEGLRENIWK